MNILTELKDLIPPLTEDEKAQLESNCLSEGIREALVLAVIPDDNAEVKEVLCDGHNRYEIAQKHNLKYKIKKILFDSLDDVKVWMIDNQKGRRNLTDGWKFELAQVKAKALRDKGREKLKVAGSQGGRGNKKPLSTIDKPFNGTPHNTQAELAKDLGWSTGKVAMADKVWRQAKPEIKQQVLAGEKSINAAYQEVRKNERVNKRQAEIASKASEPICANMDWFVNGDCRDEGISAPKGIKLIFTDPPYGMDFQSNRRVQSPKALKVANDSNVQTAVELFTDAISGLLPKMAEDSGVLCWCSWRDERYFADALTDLGLQIKNSIVWVRPNHGTGDLEGAFAFKHDRILFAVKGRPKLAPRLPDVLEGSRFLKTEHPTKKPIDLIAKVITSITSPKDIIVDPFAGSCPTGVAALETGRKFWGCELEELYWKEGQENLNNVK